MNVNANIFTESISNFCTRYTLKTGTNGI
jgi:hypothetical protein